MSTGGAPWLKSLAQPGSEPEPAAERPNIRECLRVLVRALARSDALRDHQQLNRVDEHA
jgi:hypothetical protein